MTAGARNMMGSAIRDLRQRTKTTYRNDLQDGHRDQQHDQRPRDVRYRRPGLVQVEHVSSSPRSCDGDAGASPAPTSSAQTVTSVTAGHWQFVSLRRSRSASGSRWPADRHRRSVIVGLDAGASWHRRRSASRGWWAGADAVQQRRPRSRARYGSPVTTGSLKASLVPAAACSVCTMSSCWALSVANLTKSSDGSLLGGVIGNGLGEHEERASERTASASRRR